MLMLFLILSLAPQHYLYAFSIVCLPLQQVFSFVPWYMLPSALLLFIRFSISFCLRAIFLLLSFQSSIIRQHCSHRVQTGCHERFNGVQCARSTDVHMCIQNDNWRQLSANFCSLDLKHCCVSLLYLTAFRWLQGIALPFLFASRIVFFPVCARKNNSDQKWVSSR